MPFPKPHTINLSPTSLIPNSAFPLLLYRSAFPPETTAETIEAHFRSNNWIPQWRYSMFHQSHYHSTTHEALGVFSGSARLRFGVSDKESASEGVEEDVKAGDVIIIPAGVAHRCISEKDGFMMVGAYPDGAKKWDMNYGGEHPGGDLVEKKVPEDDPVRGKDTDGLLGLWK
ncbi:uncharacterized protein H6S33_000375 [Morchella sextelata]|uniref:uncharacterized protein n=1 Tax=Morchella sextelata TaxID=1174677 RepID=UPI001D040B47|nr:uncharacterized protein H6S33_000375 [Morchella sextelata]KAH0614739.1 hypothetical protein H6S33_000375 [Morchella sextelata]